jgi:hypothetical protein
MQPLACSKAERTRIPRPIKGVYRLGLIIRGVGMVCAHAEFDFAGARLTGPLDSQGAHNPIQTTGQILSAHSQPAPPF